MNIFVLDRNPVLAAIYQCDKHVVKMILETAQILSTVQSKFGIQTKYKPTHANHPCTLWAGASKNNYSWLLEHGLALCTEYTRRYNRFHACQELFEGPLCHIPKELPDTEQTPFVQAMPDKYKNEDPVQAYRDYYIGEKSSFANWNLNNEPDWFFRL